MGNTLVHQNRICIYAFLYIYNADNGKNLTTRVTGLPICAWVKKKNLSTEARIFPIHVDLCAVSFAIWLKRSCQNKVDRSEVCLPFQSYARDRERLQSTAERADRWRDNAFFCSFMLIICQSFERWVITVLSLLIPISEGRFPSAPSPPPPQSGATASSFFFD